MPSIWPLRLATLLFVLGTAKYVERDGFHADDSSLQSVIEVCSVIVGTVFAIWPAVRWRARLLTSAPYLLFLGSLGLAVVFSFRSWDPLFSAAKGALLMMISVSTVALLSTYGALALIRSVVNAFVVLVGFGLLAGLVAPAQFPLILHDPGEEALRARLHLFKIHPIAVADACAICLIASVALSGSWIRVSRFILLGTLLFTVARASIIVGLPLYVAARVVSQKNTSQGLRRLGLICAWLLLSIAVIVGVTSLMLGWSEVQDGGNDLLRITNATRDNLTLSGRTTLWTSLITDLSVQNICGYGVGGARFYLRTVSASFSHSHNSALETIYMSGYLGLFAIVGALGLSVRSCLTRWEIPNARVFACTASYILAVGMMNPSWYDASSLIMLSMLCSVPWVRLGRVERPESARMEGLRYASSVAH